MPAQEHRQNIDKQSTHWLIQDRDFPTAEKRVTNLIDLKGYEVAAERAEGKTVLDWGCNTGYGTELLCKSAQHVAALDVSADAVEAARDRLSPHSVDVRLYDGTRCSFESDSFDLVTSFKVLEHVADYDMYLGEITRVLKPGGTLLITTPNARLRLKPGMKPWNEFHVREFNDEELKEHLSHWFREVQVLGLTGTPEIERLERDRIRRNLQASLSPFKWWRIRTALIRSAKAVLPEGVIARVQGAVRRRDQDRPAVRTRRSPAGGDAAQIPEWVAALSLEDVGYGAAASSEGLSLMAVCTL